MALLYEADSRMHEVRLVSQATCKELGGLFNQACNLSGKYLAWVEYELLRAEKNHNLNRATVILEKAPLEAVKLKQMGIKLNEDIREALIAKDPECDRSLDILNSLKAIKALLTSSYWSYKSAYESADENANRRTTTPTPNLGGEIGRLTDAPQPNFMGSGERKRL